MPPTDRLVSQAHGIETAVLEVLLGRADRPQVDAADVSADALTWVQSRHREVRVQRTVPCTSPGRGVRRQP